MKCRRYVALTIAPLLALAACTAIAGLDGEYETGAADASANLPDSPTTPDVNNTTPDGNGTTPDGARTETGAPDAGPPFDATLPSVLTTNPGTCPAPLPSANTRFCWDFNRDASARPASLGWNELLADSGTIRLNDGGAGTAARAIVATAGKQALLVWREWDAPDTDPLTIAPDQKLDFSFALTVRQAGTYAVVGALRFDDVRYGLAIHPNSCGAGLDCLGENIEGQSVDRSAATAFVPNTRYNVHIIIERKASGPWSGAISVGGRTVSTRPTVFPATAGASPLRLEIGVFDTQGTAGTTQVEIDDIFVDLFPILPQNP